MASYRASRLSQDGATNTDSPEQLRALLYHDSFVRFTLPLCNQTYKKLAGPKAYVLSCIYLVDASSLTLCHGWSIKEYAQDLSKLLAENYPEVVESIYVRCIPLLTSVPPTNALPDHQSTVLFLSDMGVGQGLVRPRHRSQDNHSRQRSREADASAAH